VQQQQRQEQLLFHGNACCHLAAAGTARGAVPDVELVFLQVITKLLYLLHQGETFTKASTYPAATTGLGCNSVCIS
jgi:hypothetical protein